MAIELRPADWHEGEDDQQLPGSAPGSEKMGSVVVTIENYDDCVARVRSDGIEGYLRVRLVRWQESIEPGVDLEVVLNTSAEWQFSDLADPDSSAALDELIAGEVDWYGTHPIVEAWLNTADAREVVTRHFAAA